MKILAVIPARGGSSLKQKNILPVAGKPLIQHTIDIAKLCDLIDDVVVTTDDPMIAKIAEDCGAHVPFIRPDEISTDLATTESVLTHCVNNLPYDLNPQDIVVYLSCTQPLRKLSWIKTCVCTLIDNEQIDSSFVGYQKHKNFWIGSTPLYWKPYTSRQQRESILEENTGTVCATRVKVIKRGDRIGSRVVVHPVDDLFVDIHTKRELLLAEYIIEKQLFEF